MHRYTHIHTHVCTYITICILEDSAQVPVSKKSLITLKACRQKETTTTTKSKTVQGCLSQGKPKERRKPKETQRPFAIKRIAISVTKYSRVNDDMRMFVKGSRP